jgi:glycosyltransferase involved in cell wall biosynthesis
MNKAVLIMPKHPFAGNDGETRVARLLVAAAAEACRVSVVALSARPGETPSPVNLVEIFKPPVRLGRLAASSAVRRRSLIHTRFAPRSLAQVLSVQEADVFFAYRDYMAQAAIDAGRVAPRDRLVVLIGPLESAVMRNRRSRLSPLFALESRRTRRDEIRCARAASEVAYLSDTESGALGDLVDGPSRRLDLVLPSAARPAPLEEPVAVFVGDRRWPPNSEALDRLLTLWPRIAAAAPRARLLVIGHPAPREQAPAASSVERRGFIDNLDDVWRSAAVLLAPIPIGGGVRVKVLDAARHGVPVVGTPEAIGSVDDYLPLSARGSDEAFTADAANLLADPAERRRRGEALFEANRELNSRGFVEGQVAELLLPGRSSQRIA